MRLIYSVIISCSAVWFLGISIGTMQYIEETPCLEGYTKIEYGKAINCKGDTIPIKEFKEMYREYEEATH